MGKEHEEAYGKTQGQSLDPSFSDPLDIEMDINDEHGSQTLVGLEKQKSSSMFSRFVHLGFMIVRHLSRFSACAVAKNEVFYPRFALQFFPATLDVVMDVPSKTSGAPVFHYLLRDMCIVWLRWSLLFQKDPSGSLQNTAEIGSSATKFLRHLVTVGFSSSADVVRVNYDYIRAFVSQWGPDIQLPCTSEGF